MHFNSDGTTGFRGKMIFFTNFVKSVVLIVNYQLPFFQSGRFPGKMNWTGVQLDLEVYPVFLIFETHIRVEIRTGTVSFHKILK